MRDGSASFAPAAAEKPGVRSKALFRCCCASVRSFLIFHLLISGKCAIIETDRRTDAADYD